MPKVETIYDGTLDPNALNQSLFFRDATMLFMETPQLAATGLDLEVDCSLQIFLKSDVQQHVDLNVFKPNQFGTVSIIPIPLEYFGLGFNRQLILISSLATQCIVRAVKGDYPAQRDIKEINRKIDDLDNWMRVLNQKLDLIIAKP